MSNFQNHFNILTEEPLSLEMLWRFAGFTPNEAQRQAIEHLDGPLYLTAGPGSGKTRVLLWRTVNLIVCHGVRPEEIFLGTFTEKAAHQLKEGLRTLLDLATNYNGKPYDLAPMYIGTVHSLCQRILTDRRHFSSLRHRSRAPQVIDALGQYFHLARNRRWVEIVRQAGLMESNNATINAIFGSSSQSKHVAVTNCIAIFNRFSEECVDPQQALERLQAGDAGLAVQYQQLGLSPQHVELLLRLYIGYTNSLTISPDVRVTDFSLLQQEAYRVLEQVPTSGQVFKHVIVDEYQDTNTIQERIFFKLAAGTNNLCVVGDDDQALYRFRGATVENFVQFPERCQQYLARSPRRISLDTNYRSRNHIVDLYTHFMQHTNWTSPDGQTTYRVPDKNIQPHRVDNQVSVVSSTAGQPETVCAEIASLVRNLIDTGKVENPNQIAFLFPSLKYNGEMTKPVGRMKAALEAQGLRVYAPRAARFLEVDESYDVFGLLMKIIGRPPAAEFFGSDYENYQHWVAEAEHRAQALMDADPQLKLYVSDRHADLERARADYEILIRTAENNHWDSKSPYQPAQMKRTLHEAPGLSDQGKKLVASQHLDFLTRNRLEQGSPLSLMYVIKRVTSIDWNLLDIFYRLCGFEHFKQMFDAAERNEDEGPVANLGLITQYLARFLDERIPLITADLLVNKVLQIVFSSYLFALYRLGETEVEDTEDPFPKGRIPFLTVHQAKGLEFPVVVLANLRKDNRGPTTSEKIIRPLLLRPPGEPLDRMSEFDIMRMFYVALSRAKNLLILAHYRGTGQQMNQPFKSILAGDDFPRIPNLNLETVPPAEAKDDVLPKSYSFTSDYLAYLKCPRQYMIFQKFGFVPSRSQTMFFGSLVHRTLEDLHHELIQRRNGA